MGKRQNLIHADSTEINVLPRLAEWWYLSLEIVRTIVGMFRRSNRRSPDRVTKDYELGVWRRAVEDRPWIRAASLHEYIERGDSSPRIAKINNRIVRVRTDAYYRFRNRMLCNILETYAAGEDELIELGCGIGMNLLAMAALGRWPRLRGMDVSENALRAARESAAHFAISQVTFHRLDLTDPQDRNFSLLKDKVVFTHYVLEQLKYAGQEVLENLIHSGVRRGIHFETGTELLRTWSLRDLVNYLYIIRRDYHGNVIDGLRQYEAAGRIRITDVRRLYYAPSVKNDPVLVVWETLPHDLRAVSM